MSFKKINSMQFEYEVSNELFEKMDKIVVEVSNGKPEDFLDVHNMHILDTLLARHIASEFIQSNEAIDSHYGMAVILVKVQNRTFRVSVADVPLNKDTSTYVSGLLYND